MTEEQKYKLITEETNGWWLYHDNAQNLTREEGLKWAEKAQDDGVAPERIRIVRQEWGT